MHACMHTCIHAYMQRAHICTHIVLGVPTCVRVCARACVPTYLRTYVRTYVHAHVHTDIHIQDVQAYRRPVIHTDAHVDTQGPPSDHPRLRPELCYADAPLQHRHYWASAGAGDICLHHGSINLVMFKQYRGGMMVKYKRSC